MRNTSPAASCALGLTFGVLTPAAPVFAQPATVEVFTSVRYSDNMAQLSDENAEADIEYRPGIRITHIKDPGQCNSALDTELAYLIYQEDTLDDQVSAELDWNGNCEITPYLNWRASDHLEEATQDARGTNTIENRERRNVFSTGPQFILPLTDVDTFLTSVDWQKTNFEENTEDNSERWIGNARLQHVFSPVMLGWLNARYSDAEFNSGEELLQTSYRVGLSRRISRTTFYGDIGLTSLERDIDGRMSEEEGTVWNLRATHNFDNASVYASVGRELTDIASDVEVAFGDIRFSVNQSQAVELTTFATGGSIALENGYDLDGSVYYDDYQYVGTEQTEEVIGMRIGASKDLSSLLSANARLRYEREDYEPSGGSADEYAAILGLNYQRTSDLRFGLDIGRETQDGRGGGVAEYTENWVAATVTYNLR